MTAISARGLKSVFATSPGIVLEGASESTRVQTITATAEQMEKASSIIFAALGDHALREARAVIGNP